MNAPIALRALLRRFARAAPNEILFIILVLDNKVILDNANKLLQSIDSVRANIRTDKNIHNRVADFQRAFVKPLREYKKTPGKP